MVHNDGGRTGTLILFVFVGFCFFLLLCLTWAFVSMYTRRTSGEERWQFDLELRVRAESTVGSNQTGWDRPFFLLCS